MQHNFISANLVRIKLSRYLSGRIPLPAFRKWFIPTTWDVEECASADLQELVYGIKLALAEYSSGHLSQVELRSKLFPFATSAEPD